MKKTVKFASMLLALVMCLFSFACGGGKNSKYDSEKDSLTLSLSGADGVFNPFFSTAAYDSEVVAMTQIGMLGSDKNGNYTYGDDEAVVTKDLKITMIGENGLETSKGEDAQFTDYEFLIKKGIKFSDGVDLTIKDVLFNLYLYLDPVYTGSATIYSTDIYGLTSYRTQIENADDKDQEATDAKFESEADARLLNVTNYLQNLIDSRPDTLPEDTRRQVEADIASFSKLYREELNAIYQNSVEGLEDYTKEYQVSEPYQLFFYLTEFVNVEVDEHTKLPIKENGKYKLDFSSLDPLVTAYAEEHFNDEGIEGATEEERKENAKKEFCIEAVHEAYTTDEKQLKFLIDYSDTAVKIREQFTAEQRSKYYEEHRKDDGSLLVPNIKGITAYQTNSFNGKTLDGNYDVLKIRINKVDPKAIWNFGFSVAPMHYYSDAKHVAEFSYENNRFGLDYNSVTFMNEVVKSPDKIGIPVGAGPYMASTDRGTTPGQKVEKNEFLKNNMVYYERNPYFETLGGSIKNAKIKYLRYRVINTNQILNNVIKGEVDFGQPNATQSNIDQVRKDDNLGSSLIETNGYGYVGINAKYVPDIYVRRAIMKAMDVTIITRNYYSNGLAENIYRPMSKVSFAYPEGCTTYVDSEDLSYAYDASGEEILNLLLQAGYRQQTVDGKKQLGKVDDVTGKWTPLKYTFTIAGDSEDHPAWTMFDVAKNILNKIGFEIIVKKDNFALQKMSSGQLAVWAAAWSSTIDPDMYQVYHKDSTATSVLNWGYDVIKKNLNHKYDTELAIVEELSTQIELGRQTISQAERKNIYAKALDLVMELAVEMPTYQRKDYSVYRKDKIDPKTLVPEGELSAYNGLLSRIWEVDFVK